MTVNITPLHDRVLVRRLEEKETATLKSEHSHRVLRSTAM